MTRGGATATEPANVPGPRTFVPTGDYLPVDLSGQLNHRGADLLPDTEVLSLDGVPFRLAYTYGDPRHGYGYDHVRCDRQLVTVPPGRYDRLYVLAAAERDTQDWVFLHFACGETDLEWLRVPELYPGDGKRRGFRNPGYRRWRQSVPVPRRAELTALRLPDNPAVHVYAITALRTP